MADDEELDDPFKTENRQWPGDSGKATHDRELGESDRSYRRWEHIEPPQRREPPPDDED